MQVIPPALERLIGDLAKLPGIGRKSATRLALYILRRPMAEARTLADDLMTLHETIHLCHRCFTFSETDPCAICGNPGRNPRLVCVVEEPGDQIAIEKTGAFRGVYHILHGVIAPMDGIGPAELKMRELWQRVASGEVDEVLIATSSTVPGEATASYLAEMLKDSHVRLSRLACGIPMGMDIKYADEHTLAKAIESRQDLKDLS
ncbi:recombination mediator RecR [Desulfobulbus elongatus]|uniref:recombination mediator RecR n=1 Tax=Desulfobulbus elongatus TaxID=53332 RepID=UPI000488C710|nr:recombination mediator RecR [Desulfobulbus elongatus]